MTRDATKEGGAAAAFASARRTGMTAHPRTPGAILADAALPEQRTPTSAGAAAEADPAEHRDPARAADAVASECLLRCWVRETRPTAGPERELRLPLRESEATLRVPVRYWSATGLHRFGPPRLHGATARPLDAVTLAALLGRESGAGPEHVTALVGRVADSVQRTAAFLAARRAQSEPAVAGDPFLDAEQSLVLGHPMHPAPKSREGFAGTEAVRCSPELRGAFRLHWFAVDRSLAVTDSAWTEHGAVQSARDLALRLAGGARALPGLPDDAVPLPLHPWQARDLVHRPGVAALRAAGLLTDLGEHGGLWYPTSSVRTVYQPGAPAMLKLSLGVRITNSRRENLRKELHRGVEVHRLLESGLGARWRAACDEGRGFDIVRDPAWLAVNDRDGRPVPGLDVVVRHNPFAPGEDAVCVAGLLSPRPWPNQPEGVLRSRLAGIITGLARRTGRGVPATATEWLLRYLRTVVSPVLWLDAEAGVALEAHQQNTLVLLDGQGWPCGGRYRDNQGFYFRQSRRASLERWLPGIGRASDTFVADEVATERLAYYLGINNVLGLIGALGSQRLAPERVLLAAARRFLERQVTRRDRVVSPAAELLLERETLSCKANLLTRLRGLDELTGPVDGQSVYVTIPNPLAENRES